VNELSLIIRIALALFFLLSGVAKLRAGRAGLERVVGEYPWVPGNARLPLGVLLVAIELAAGIGLFTAAARESALAISGLLVVFVGVVGVEVARGAHHGCGCLGSAAHGRPIGWSLLVEDLVMLVGGLTVAAAGGQAIPNELGRSAQPVAVVLASLGLVGLSLLWAEFDATRSAFADWRIATAAGSSPYGSIGAKGALDA
jgi:Methylamine utilisation protein MauE